MGCPNAILPCDDLAEVHDEIGHDALRVVNDDLALRADDLARVADLTAAFWIERGLHERDLDLVTLGYLAHDLTAG